MLPGAGPDTRHMLFGGGIREVRRHFVDMQMFQQIEACRTEYMGVLQNQHGIPVAARDQQRQGRA